MENILDIGFHTLIFMNSTYPSTFWDKSSASYARALAKYSMSVLTHPLEPSASSRGLSGDFQKLFDVKRKPLFALTSMTDSASEFVATSASVMSTTSVPLTSLKSRVSSTPSSASLSASPTTRSSVLEQTSVPVFQKDGILGQAGSSLSVQELGKKSLVLIQDFVFNSVAPGTLKIYKYTWDLFKKCLV